jgi:glycosyltransferase involved in cell wall biosynthesis
VSDTRQLRIAFVADGDPRDPDLLSGTPYRMLSALERHADVVVVIGQPWSVSSRALRKAMRIATRGHVNMNFSPRFVRLALHDTWRRLRAAAPDIVFAPVCTPTAGALTKGFAVAHASDATPRVMRGYYPGTESWGGRSFERFEATERYLLQHALLAFYPSDWAADSAIADYGLPRERAAVIAWGANQDHQPDAAPRDAPAGGALRLLFVGKDWLRKGGDVALEAVERLRTAGINAELDVVGCDAAVLAGAAPAHLRFHGLVDKRQDAGRTLIERLYAQAHLFILPTRAECYGIVFAEAAHHALPAIGYATGGTPAAVRDGETGILLPPAADAGDVADAIMALVRDGARYRAMSAAALADARARLDWDRWAQEAVTCMTAALTPHPPPHRKSR